MPEGEGRGGGDVGEGGGGCDLLEPEDFDEGGGGDVGLNGFGGWFVVGEGGGLPPGFLCCGGLLDLGGGGDFFPGFLDVGGDPGLVPPLGGEDGDVAGGDPPLPGLVPPPPPPLLPLLLHFDLLQSIGCAASEEHSLVER